MTKTFHLVWNNKPVATRRSSHKAKQLYRAKKHEQKSNRSSSTDYAWQWSRAWDIPLPCPSRPFPFLLFLPPLPSLSLLCFCFVACSALHCLLFCVPGSGSCVLLPPPSSLFRSLFCLLIVSLFCCGWLSLFPPSFSPPSCLCVFVSRTQPYLDKCIPSWVATSFKIFGDYWPVLMQIYSRTDSNSTLRSCWVRFTVHFFWAIYCDLLQNIAQQRASVCVCILSWQKGSNRSAVNAWYAGGQSSLMLLCPTKLCTREGSIHWPWMCTCESFDASIVMLLVSFICQESSCDLWQLG